MITAALKNHPQVELYTYPGRNHAFARVGGEHYDAADAAKAGQRTLAFFERTLS
jgi:carboxymethylenebutenolidase